MRRFIRRVLPIALLIVGAAPLGTSASAAVAAPAAASANPAPAVQPGIREWRGGRGMFHLSHRARIVLEAADSAELKSTARTFATDLSAITGRTLPIVTGTPRADDIALRGRSADTQLGPQGYAWDIGDILTAEATGDTGVFYATQSSRPSSSTIATPPYPAAPPVTGRTSSSGPRCSTWAASISPSAI
ncbi:glycoside hydrolase family 20 zincin-like fold domain-containing protein [Streptomyces sp. NPDC048680]|uniref:glycoside hydrolase family 20 zincin-like fold domain-containing protein n=1 Tax=Streptomyces sp. NPDC048680 TaxID=3155492 RepID=UPI00342C14B8